MLDVVVVGAGFAGLTAARELAAGGAEVLVVEARDRIAGRTWTDTWGADQLEIGGGWVHWFQPHTWSELTRAGLGIKRSMEAERITWRAEGELRSAPLEHAHGRLITEAWDRFVAGAETALPRPHDPYFAWDAAAPFDAESCAERLAGLGLDPDSEALLHAELIGLVHGPIADAGVIAPMRWHALSGYSLAATEETGGVFGVDGGGMSALAAAMLAQARCALRLETPVARIERHADRAIVTTAAGEQLEARAVVVTVPLNALGGIEFAPALPDAARGWIAQGQASQGMKLWIRARGDVPPTLALAPASPLSFVMPDRVTATGETLLVTFSERASDVRPDDLAWVQRELDAIAPGYEVVETLTHDWTADVWSRGTWAVHRPGWWASGYPAFAAPHGRLVFAGSDLAHGWAGFVDGAIESGHTAARRVRELLAS